MEKLTEKFKSITKIQVTAFTLIIVGLVIMLLMAVRMFAFHREPRYAMINTYTTGDLPTDQLRPWMSLRFISVAYAVPQKYLFDKIGIQPQKETSMIGLDRLNRQMKLGETDGQPELMKTVREAIESYRADPVATGLIEQHVEGWMSVQYIANSIGIPAEDIFAQIDIPLEGNAYKPLDILSRDLDYPGGQRELVAAVQQAVDTLAPQKGQP